MGPHVDITNNFDINSLPDLDVVVLAALERFAGRELPRVDISSFKRPLVVGSGNAEATGRIIFGDSDAVFASESNFAEKLEHIADIDEVVILSASGGKHAPVIAKAAAAAGKHVTLITNSQNSPAEQALTAEQITVHALPKNREPYTYNTSTYMGMILTATHEDTAAIQAFIHDVVDAVDFSRFNNYEKFFVIVPTEFSGLVDMVQTKFIELFGRQFARDVKTAEFMRHATTVVPSEELFISFGEPNTIWGTEDHRVHIPLPEGAGYTTAMAIMYYVVGKIQKVKPQWFKENVAGWAEFIGTTFNDPFSPIVDGNEL